MKKHPTLTNIFINWGIIGQLNFLKKLTQPNIAYATHQVARLCQDLKATHAEAIKHIAKYICNTSNKGIILHPQNDKSFDVIPDADFVGN
jgi:hypothetical protein